MFLFGPFFTTTGCGFVSEKSLALVGRFFMTNTRSVCGSAQIEVSSNFAIPSVSDLW